MILICILLLGVVILYSYNASRSETLEIGVFVGSNWDVANANSYTIVITSYSIHYTKLYDLQFKDSGYG